MIEEIRNFWVVGKSKESLWSAFLSAIRVFFYKQNHGFWFVAYWSDISASYILFIDFLKSEILKSNESLQSQILENSAAWQVG